MTAKRLAGLRGMKTFIPAKIDLTFKAIVNRPALPVVPPGFGYISGDVNWGMKLNATCGDCVIAGGEHENMLWCWATGKPIPTFDDPATVRNYGDAQQAEGEPRYIMGDNRPVTQGGTDTGLDPVTTAEWRRTVGFLDSTGQRHRDYAYAAVTNPNELIDSSFIFGACGTAFGLPDSAEDQFNQGVPWSDTSGPPKSGHYVPLVGRNPVTGNLVFLSWGHEQEATLAWVAKYMMGGVAYINKQYLNATQLTPGLINFALLQEYLQGVTQVAELEQDDDLLT